MLQREKTRFQKEANQRRIDYNNQSGEFQLVLSQWDQLLKDLETKQQLVRSLKRELGEDDTELEEDVEDTISRRVRNECKKRVKIYEDRLKRAQADEQIQAALLEQIRKELAVVRDMVDDAQRGAVTMFNEQKRYESYIERLTNDVHRANSAVDKMRTESVNLRLKIQDVRDERGRLQQRFDEAEVDNQRAIEERDSIIVDLRTVVERRNQELDSLEQSMSNTQDDHVSGSTSTGAR